MKRAYHEINREWQLIHGDSLQRLQDLPDESVKLIITSPPYNIGKEYENKNTTIDEYLAYQSQIIKQLNRILKIDGSICWQVGNYVDNGGIIPLDILTYNLFMEQRMIFRKRFIWHYGFGMHLDNRFSGRYEVIMWYTKSDSFLINIGKNLGPKASLLETEFESELMCFPNVKGSHVEKTIHPCQFPIELAERYVLYFSNPNDVILDPFCGVGSTIIACIKNQRIGWGIDKEESYLEYAKSRVESFQLGSLKIRQLGTPILIPSGKIAKKPVIKRSEISK